MPRTGTATLPLHHGKAPKWLFERMTLLSHAIMYAIVREFGQKALLEKLSDPYWFQALGCVLGFDWHSSGLTTTVTGALKEGLRGMEHELGIFMAGGKGATSRKTPEQIVFLSEKHGLGFDCNSLVHASRMSAKVDNTAVQDGYQLYHHVMVFTYTGEWSVIQQGMDQTTKTARRYHWLGSSVSDFTNEPHSAICCDRRAASLNMVAAESREARNTCTEVACERPDKTVREIQKIVSLDLSARHDVTLSDIDPKKLHRVLIKTYERQPENFEQLLGIRGIGPKTIRALSLVSEIIYGKPASYRDPARFSFAHGGKDGTPFPVDRATFDKTITVLRSAISKAQVGRQEQLRAIYSLEDFFA